MFTSKAKNIYKEYGLEAGITLRLRTDTVNQTLCALMQNEMGVAYPFPAVTRFREVTSIISSSELFESHHS